MAAARARLLRLIRMVPGQSPEAAPTGVVADAVVFPDGTSVLHWRSMPAATEIYPSEHAMRQVRERSGRSRFEVVP